MKRAIYILGCVLFVLIVLLPFGTLLASRFGYTFELAGVSVFAVVTASLSVCLVILNIKYKEAVESRVIKMLYALLTPLSIINTVFYVFEIRKIWIVYCMFVCIGCCLFLTIKHGKPLALKVTALVLSALMVMPIEYFIFIVLLFGNIGQNTVVNSVESPNGAYYAEVIDNDQGALGGNTFVNVYENKEINALIFKISKEPQRVYRGLWGEFEDMDIYWKDNGCLVINSVEYKIE